MDNENEQNKEPSKKVGSLNFHEKLSEAIIDKFGESVVDEDGEENDPYNWWLQDVTAGEIAEFIEEYLKS